MKKRWNLWAIFQRIRCFKLCWNTWKTSLVIVNQSTILTKGTIFKPSQNWQSGGEGFKNGCLYPNLLRISSSKYYLKKYDENIVIKSAYNLFSLANSAYSKVNTWLSPGGSMVTSLLKPHIDKNGNKRLLNTVTQDALRQFQWFRTLNSHTTV